MMVTKIEAGTIFIFLPYSLLKRAGAIRLKVNFCLFCLGAVSNVMRAHRGQSVDLLHSTNGREEDEIRKKGWI